MGCWCSQVLHAFGFDEISYLYEVTKKSWSEADEAASSSHLEVLEDMVLSKRCMVLVLLVLLLLLEVCVMMFDCGGSARKSCVNHNKTGCQQQVSQNKQSRGFQKKNVTAGEESEERRKIVCESSPERSKEERSAAATNDLFFVCVSVLCSLTVSAMTLLVNTIYLLSLMN